MTNNCDSLELGIKLGLLDFPDVKARVCFDS